MLVAGLQVDIAWEDPQANFVRFAPRVAAAAAAGARLVLLPEMYATGFSMAAERIAEPPGGQSTAFLVEQAQRHGVWVGGSLPERRAPRPANVFVLAAPDGTLHRYAKLHPFGYSGEDRHYSAGDAHVTVEVEGLRVTLFVCYDLRFADDFWECAQATDCYLVIANWPAARRSHWSTLLAARAIENQAYVVGVNRVGTDGNDLRYSGDSAVIDPLGRTLAAAATQETMILAEVDPAEVGQVRARLPFLADRVTRTTR